MTLDIDALNARTRQLAHDYAAMGIRPETAGVLARFTAAYAEIHRSVSKRVGHSNFSEKGYEFMLTEAMKLARREHEKA